MKVRTKNRIAVAWLLLMTVMPVFVVKAMHHHEEIAVCHSDNGHPQSPCNQCPVCHFTLSPFTQAESFHIQIIIPLFNYEPVAYMGMKGYQPVHPYNLRAPPSLSALL